jgi:hypothetical protein
VDERREVGKGRAGRGAGVLSIKYRAYRRGRGCMQMQASEWAAGNHLAAGMMTGTH